MKNDDVRKLYKNLKNPSEFMRSIRPEEFSDSIEMTDIKLSKEILEYTLAHLTKHMKELAFEQFARRLLEKEICPNLMPMTGPIGGGDGKVDSNNYPVSEDIASTWLVNSPEQAATEKWAFAFSAKKKWRSKVNADVKSIIGTSRGYSKIFFVTNQFVSGKKRQEVQDKLGEIYKVQLSILDRNWILEKVFNNGHQALAVECLHITNIEVIQNKSIGAKDTKRQSDLNAIEKNISDPNRYYGLQYQLAEDCLSSALIARGLGQSLNQIRTKFERALRIARKVEMNSQLLRIIYHLTWTLFFWYDQTDELLELYTKAEGYAVDSMEADHLLLLSNLWFLLFPKGRVGENGNMSHEFEDITNRLITHLDLLINDNDRPTNSLKAKYLKFHIIFVCNSKKGINNRPVLIEFSNIAKRSESKLGFPTEQFVHRIEIIGEMIQDNDTYDNLLLECLELLESRTGEAKAGQGMMRRGYQLLKKKKYTSSVIWFGKAIGRLAKYEYTDELVRALLGCSFAYSELGLEWAARTQLVAAAAINTSDIAESGRPSKLTHDIMKRLVWTELRLGRIPCVINSIMVLDAITHLMEPEEVDMSSLEKEFNMIDAVLGILIIQSTIEDLKLVPQYPDLLENIGCIYSKLFLLYAMGNEDLVKAEGLFEDSTTSEEMYQFFLRTFDQPAFKQLEVEPNHLLGSTLRIMTRVLGCDIIIEMNRYERSVHIAETICSSVESLLATGMIHKFFSHRSKINVCVFQDLEIGEKISIEVMNRRIILHHAPGQISESEQDLCETNEWIKVFFAHLVTDFFMIDHYCPVKHYFNSL